jgi:hypothetical protein
MHDRSIRHHWVWILLLCATMSVAGCGRRKTTGVGPGMGANAGVVPGIASPIDLPQVEVKPGTAIMILVDTSGSMGKSVRAAAGAEQPKHQIAQDALRRILAHTAKWKREHPDRPLQLGICFFNSSVGTALPMGDFDEASANAALQKLPKPNSGTAIGTALEKAAKELYKSGVARKHIVCITDGENTVGISPEVVARQLHAQTTGGIDFHFVAFDTSAQQFAFLNQVKGYVTQAADGNQLQAELTKIYDQRILAEKEDPQP